MPTLQSPGIGSGLDINSLVTQLVAAERTPTETRITQREARLTTQVSALASLKGALSAFKSALENLRTTDTFLARKATVSNESVLAASASGAAAPGSYEIEVVTLAQAHQLASGAFADGATSEVGTGTLTITLGAESFDVEVDSENNTLDAIRDAINAHADNPGVRATLVHGVDGSRLVLTSSKTGAENAITVAAAGGDGGLNALVYDPLGTTNLTELRPASDALIRVAGFDHMSTSNVIEGAIDGVTLTLKSGDPGNTLTLDVAYDSAVVTERVKKFVAEYNNLNARIAALRGYNPDTKQAGALLGDALLRSVESEIRRGLSDPIDGLSGDYTSLVNLGITTTATGSLTLDETKLQAALAADPDAAAAIFASENGVGARLYERVDARLESDAEIETRSSSLQDRIRDLSKEKEALDLRMAAVEARYRKQFTALDTLLAQLQSTSSYLAQQLANLPKIGES